MRDADDCEIGPEEGGVQYFPSDSKRTFPNPGRPRESALSPYGAGYTDGVREGSRLFSDRLTELEEDVDLLKFIVKMAAITAVVIALALASRPLEEVRR